MIKNKIFEYDEEDLEYYEIKNHILVSKGIALFIFILFLFMILFSFATISKYLEAKANEKTAKEVAVELNSELQQSELNLYYWKENQLKQQSNN